MERPASKNALKALKKNQLITLCQQEQLITTGVCKELFTRLVKHFGFDAAKDEEEEDYSAAEVVEFMKMYEQALQEMERKRFETEEDLLRLGKSRKFPGNLIFLTRQYDRSKLVHRESTGKTGHETSRTDSYEGNDTGPITACWFLSRPPTTTQVGQQCARQISSTW